MAAAACWLIIATASVTYAQFFDFPIFSPFFTGVSNQRSSFPEFSARRADDSEGHNRRRTTQKPEPSHDVPYEDRSRKSTQRPAATTARIAQRKMIDISFSSFIDVPSAKDGTREFFSTQNENNKSSTARTSTTSSPEYSRQSDSYSYSGRTTSRAPSYSSISPPDYENPRSISSNKPDYVNDYMTKRPTSYSGRTTSRAPSYSSISPPDYENPRSISSNKPDYVNDYMTKRPTSYSGRTTSRAPSYSSISPPDYETPKPISSNRPDYVNDYTTKRPTFGVDVVNFARTTKRSRNPIVPTNSRPVDNSYDVTRNPFSTTKRPQNFENDVNGLYTSKIPNTIYRNDNMFDSDRQGFKDRPNDDRRQSFETDRPINNRRPSYETDKPTDNRTPIYEPDRHNEYQRPGYDSNTYTTQFHTDSPGVLRPNVDESRDPITNKPPYVSGNRGQSGASDFVFRDDDQEPEHITGPDVEFMSEEKKRRALQIAERMCERYASENTEHLAAIPLIPAPAPVTVSVSKCAPINVPLVVGGQVVTIQQYPHMAALGWPYIRGGGGGTGGGGYSWKCGGTLVSELYVLTAAHCSHQDRDNTVVQGAPRVVQLGSARLSDPGATVVRVAAAVRHPKYKPPAAYYDIALLKLATAVRFTESVRPACIGEPPEPGHNIIATGWGRTEFGGAMSEQLRGVSLPVWETSECSRALGTSRKLPRGALADAQICAGELRGGKDTCQGDSGGPAVVGSSCLWRVVGVTSLGRACGAPRTPALYARAHTAFIAAVVWL